MAGPPTFRGAEEGPRVGHREKLNLENFDTSTTFNIYMPSPNAGYDIHRHVSTQASEHESNGARKTVIIAFYGTWTLLNQSVRATDIAPFYLFSQTINHHRGIECQL